MVKKVGSHALKGDGPSLTCIIQRLLQKWQKVAHIFCATYACIFLNVPNRGMNIEQLKVMVKGQPNENLVSNLGIELQFLNLLHDTFCERFSFKVSLIISVYETKLSRTVEV